MLFDGPVAFRVEYQHSESRLKGKSTRALYYEAAAGNRAAINPNGSANSSD